MAEVTKLERNADQIDKEVLETVIQHRAMPFLELESLTDMDEAQLREAVDHLEEQHFVKTDHRGDLFREIVTATGLAFNSARHGRLSTSYG